jgi:acyl-CoA thioester hydrolase
VAKADFTFSHRVRVRYAEIDAQAVVFNSRYLEYADIGITEYWRAVGIAMTPGPDTPEFHVAKATVEYKAPMRFDEEIDVCVRLARVGRSSVTTLLELHGAGGDDLRAVIEEIHVHVDLHSGTCQPLPGTLIAKFEAYEGKPLRAPVEA